MSNTLTTGSAELAKKFMYSNYNYVWLKAMLKKDSIFRKDNPTLITGSSHALNGIKADVWDNAINCSMHSQDIYYDFKCAQEVIREKNRFSKCFIVFGYYIAYQDLSLSKVSRETMINSVYYPIFKDAHNWTDPTPFDLWNRFSGLSDEEKKAAEALAVNDMAAQHCYYSDIMPRGSYFDLNGRAWADISDTEKDNFGKIRAKDHNRVCTHTASFTDNIEILKDFVHFLHINGTMPIVVITPFTEAYNRYIDPYSRESVLEMLNRVPEEVHFVDLNEFSFFDDSDFKDTDHLNEKGAEKVSRILVKMFGK